MNQYEIELRDKYFDMKLEDLLRKGGLESCNTEQMCLFSFNFADKCMAER